jgi:phosphoribosylformylglycinamidine synthase
VHRVEVHPLERVGDPHAQRVVRLARERGHGVTAARTAKVYLIEIDAADEARSPGLLDAVVQGLLVNPVTERGVRGAAEAMAGSATVEVHPLAGVMDPAGQSVGEAIGAMLGVSARVSTGTRYDLGGVDDAGARAVAAGLLANPVVQGVHGRGYCPGHLPVGHESAFVLRHVALRDLDDAGLEKLSREAHLFLDLHEMRAIRDEYRGLGREPTDIELETLAQTWSEHCVHKTLKSTIRYRGHPAAGPDPIDWRNRPGHEVHPDGSVTIRNLLRSTVAAATHRLIAEGTPDRVGWTLSVFKDNAGVIALDDEHAINIKVETHNHPSALEPYGGAATGIGGCIRDVVATGLGAKPIASTDVFCVAPPSTADVPAGCIHPRRTLTEVVAGIRDYGNRMGIPTVSGAVWFDERHIGNPLVFAGCLGLMRRGEGDALIAGAARPGDLVVALGGRTGRDGIHGATFSSAELTDTHADEFAHAVQIGNAIEQKRTVDAILRARDAGPLFHAITDCGAGGFSSAVGEMGSSIGAEVHLDRAPLKYDGLSYTEIWISEAQERFVLAVPPANLDALARICAQEHVELSVLGTFGTPDGPQGPELILHYRAAEVGRLPMHFLHEGIPTPTRDAVWTGGTTAPGAQHAPIGTAPARQPLGQSLRALLAHPNIASKHWIIRQYDHEVQGNTVSRPLVGPSQRGPADASVIEPVPGSGRGVAVSCGLATGLEADPYLMTLAAIDECVRNLVCVGADPSRIAILDNFCWPSCKKPENLGSLVRAAEACYDGALAYRTPFVSGKDSLNNQFTIPATPGRPALTIEIPPTLLITGIGIVPEIARAVTMDAKRPGSLLVVVGRTQDTLAGSHYLRHVDPSSPAPFLARTDLDLGPRTARSVAWLIASGVVRAAHDCSDGGLLVAVAEMLIAGSTAGRPIGATVDLSRVKLDERVAAFGECPSRVVLEVDPHALGRVQSALEDAGVQHAVLGELDASGHLRGSGLDEPVEALAESWLRPLDW